MDNREAIEILKANRPDACFEQLREAVDMAISALWTQEVRHSTESSLTQKGLDTISRQEAIGEFPEDALPWDTFDGYVAPHHVRKILERLPSAQPEPTKINIEDFNKEDWER